MKANEADTDLFFGDDFNYVKLPGDNYGTDRDYGVEIGTGATNTWRFDLTGNLTLPQTDMTTNPAPSSWPGITFSDGTFQNTSATAGAANIGNYLFDADTLNMPLNAKLNSGGVGTANSAELGTTVAFEGEYIVDSEIYMGSGYGEFRSIYNKNNITESGLAYAGVEGFNYAQFGDVNFSGMVSQTPQIDSMYSLSVNERGQIVIGFTQNGQTLRSNDWSVTVGTLNTGMTVSGLFANTTQSVVAGGTGNNSSITLDDSQVKITMPGTPASGTATPNWYSIYGELTGAGDHATLNGGVAYDSAGNIYTIGSFNGSGGDWSSDNLFI
jgi:hypothetical protein